MDAREPQVALTPPLSPQSDAKGAGTTYLLGTDGDFPWVERMTMKLPRKYVKQELEVRHNQLWQSVSHLGLENTADDDKINAGIPTPPIASAVLHIDGSVHMSWPQMILAGVCTPQYASNNFREQLNNLTLVAVLLAGFAIGFAISPPEFDDDDANLPSALCVALTHIYGLAMLASGLTCFGATVIALHSLNRIANSCPTKSSMLYICENIFYPAREAIERYIFMGIVFMVFGLIAAFVLLFNAFFSIPALVVSALFCWWFLRLYQTWGREAKEHNHVADGLAAMDISIAAKAQKSIGEGLVGA